MSKTHRQVESIIIEQTKIIEKENQETDILFLLAIKLLTLLWLT
jgi:hypothetical protein